MKGIKYIVLIVLVLSLMPNNKSENQITNIIQSDIKSTNLSDIISDSISFIDSSQDKFIDKVNSMDNAYYIGKIIYNLQQMNYTLTPKLLELKESVFKFLEKTRNENGGWANWHRSRSSMESTYQALDLYSNFNMLDRIKDLQISIDFINSLLTPSGGYFPLPDWDVPDITSTFRAISILKRINNTVSEIILDNKVQSYLIGNIKLIDNSTGGFSEISKGKVDLLATYYASKSISLISSLDIINSTMKEYMGNFINKLSFNNGGLAGTLTGRPTTGFTARGIQLIQLFDEYAPNSIFSLKFNKSYIDLAYNYIYSNKIAGSGFSSSDRDDTASLVSTNFAINIIKELIQSKQINSIGIELSDIEYYIKNGVQPSFGIANYPGDTSDLSYTTRALLIGKMASNMSWVNSGVGKYIDSTYDKSGGYGFRPGTEPTIKYTYYGIKAHRMINASLDQSSDIRNYILSAQNPNGMFGKKPDYQLGYITYTYWALSSLNLLGYLNDSMYLMDNITKSLESYRNFDSGYTNFPGGDSTIISTFRALQLRKMLGEVINGSDPFASSIFLYQHPSGGYIDKFTKTIPSIEATYYAIRIAKMLNISFNKTLTKEYVLSLRNDDGGFGYKTGFSSRVSSTYQALSLLYILDNDKINDNLIEDTDDYFAPLIYPTFNKKLDDNKTIQGSFSTQARIIDPEGETVDSWIEVIFTGKVREYYIYEGSKGEDYLWTYILGPFDKGNIKFRVVAIDKNNNTAKSEYFLINSLGNVEQDFVSSFSLSKLLLSIIPIVAILLALFDTIYTYKKNKRGEIKMHLKENEIGVSQSLNITYLILFMTGISALARILLQDAILVLQASSFLFQYLFAVIAILVLRYIIGLKSYGYFGPSIIAVSWLKLGLFWGSLLFLNLLLICLIARALIQPFGLPVGFRIGIIMMFLISSLTVLEVVGEIYKINFISGSILIPILITPWMADRYVNEMQEQTAYDAFSTLLSTIFIIFIAYLVMGLNNIIVFVILNPELWIVMLVFIFYFGKTRVYTKLDKRRFSRLFKKSDTPLTMVTRNRDYLSKYNQKIVFPFINKLNMKELFDEWRVPTATLYAVISDESQLDDIMNRITQEEIFKDGFVIKPSESYGGKGIIVVSRRENDYFIINQEKYHTDALREHIQKIMQGEFLTSQTSTISDVVIIEEKIIVEKSLGNISTGLPDIRVIIFKGIPIMCMARLPTSYSEGKANLKQGAIGAGIDMETGIITHAEYKQHPLDTHPDTGSKIMGYQFNKWNEILAVACLAQKSTGLGYAGVDIVIDNKDRILVLEINKRPGLEIQNINLSSLLFRNKYIEENDLDATQLSPLKAAQIGRGLAKHWRKNNE